MPLYGDGSWATINDLASRQSADELLLASIQASQSFVTQTILTVAQVKTDYPAAAQYRGKYVRVSDLWGLVDGVMRCGYNGRIYYWEPTTQPTLAGDQRTIGGNGSATIQPLSSAPIFELVGNLALGQTYNLTLGTDDLWPGAIKEVRNSLTTLLGGLNILGTGIGSTVSSLLGGSRRFVGWDNGTAVVWRQLT